MNCKVCKLCQTTENCITRQTDDTTTVPGKASTSTTRPRERENKNELIKMLNKMLGFLPSTKWSLGHEMKLAEILSVFLFSLFSGG